MGGIIKCRYWCDPCRVILGDFKRAFTDLGIILRPLTTAPRLTPQYPNRKCATLNAFADEYALKAENERKISHIIHSNALKEKAQVKEVEEKTVEKYIDEKLLELKNSV